MATAVSTHQIRVDHALSCPAMGQTSGPVTIAIAAGQITSITPALRGQTARLALPALVNAHDHGRGLAPFTFGALDQSLELWLPALKQKPPISVYSQTALALAKLAHSGVGSVVHCHNPSGGDLWAETAAVCQAARDVGLRLAFAVPMSDRNALAYGDSQKLLALLPEGDRHQVSQLWDPTTLSPQAQVERANQLAAAFAGDLIDFQYCPRGPQWCSNQLLEAIAAASADTGRPIHTHLLESKRQREWADAHYPQGLVRYLDDIGFLSPLLTVAHGVWLRPDEQELLAERGVVVAVNTSSNLRLRSGIPPYQKMRAAGLAVAFGLDGLSLHGSEDFFEELRLNYHLHAQADLYPLTPMEMLEAHRHGAWAVTHRADVGGLQVGQAADIAVLDYGAMTPDVVPEVCPAPELVLNRASQHFVTDLWVNGRRVLKAGALLGLDEAGLTAEVQAATQSQSQHVYSLQPLVQRYQDALRQFYGQRLHQQS
ncbi:cytosine deaminase [filamentous cyanobacterium CCP5]|nr:cytosine deaminase [filamentous cyanobacterium CCP5]